MEVVEGARKASVVVVVGEAWAVEPAREPDPVEAAQLVVEPHRLHEVAERGELRALARLHRGDEVLQGCEPAAFEVEPHDLELAPARRLQCRVAVEKHGLREPVVLAQATGIQRAVPGGRGDVRVRGVELVAGESREDVRLEQDLRAAVALEAIAGRLDSGNRANRRRMAPEKRCGARVVGVGELHSEHQRAEHEGGEVLHAGHRFRMFSDERFELVNYMVGTMWHLRVLAFDVWVRINVMRDQRTSEALNT